MSIKNIWISFYQFATKVIVQISKILISLLPTRIWLLIRDKTRIVDKLDYPQAPIKIVVDSWIERDYRLGSCKKEPGTIEWIEEWFKPDDVFYDIGANVGAYSLVAFKHLDGNIKINAFEPGFSTFSQLCKNISLNSAEESIFPWPVALSEKTMIQSFHYQNLVPGGALHSLGDTIDQHGISFQPVLSLPVLSYRLSDFIKQFHLPIPTHIKIDVDGTEFQVLKGAEDLLKRPEFRSILFEFNQEHEDNRKILQLLEVCGLVFHSERNENVLYWKKAT